METEYLKNLVGYLNSQKYQPKIEISHTGLHHCKYCDIDVKNVSSHERTKKHINRESEYIIGKARKDYYEYSAANWENEAEREKWNNRISNNCIQSINQLKTGERILSFDYLQDSSLY